MGKHAYLLIVHEYTYVLETLLKCINDKRNDVFLHNQICGFYLSYKVRVVGI